MPSVSVIIPAYNAAHYLTEAIQSVVHQTYQDFEIIVIDDGSSDNTTEIIGMFNDPRLRYIYQSNKGMPGARNTGIKASNGEYVAFLDADDTFLPHKLSSQVGILDQDPSIGLVAGGLVQVNEKREILGTLTPWKHSPRLDVLTLLYHCPFLPSVVIARRGWLERVGLFDEHLLWVDDWDLWLRLAYAGCRMEWDRKVLGTYRIHPGGMSRNAKMLGEYRMRALDKFYARSDLTSEVIAAKDHAYAIGHINKIARLYLAGEFEEAKKDVRQAIELNPGLLEGEPAMIIYGICNRVFKSHFVEDKLQLLADVERNFPRVITDLKRHFRKAIAKVWITTVFEAHEEGKARVTRNALLKGIYQDPAWLCNRGIWSIGLEAFLGRQVAAWLRHLTGTGKRQRSMENA